MPKGFFTQGFALLTDGSTTIEEVTRALQAARASIAKTLSGHENDWFSGPTVVVPFLPEVNGNVSIDVVSKSWPDSMGHPKSDPMLFGAWSMGHFGPHAFPGSLERAAQQAWSWPRAAEVVAAHRGFIRLRMSYVFGAGGDAPVLPKEYDPVDELMYLSKLTMALAGVPGVLCYFNPNAEVLRPMDDFSETFRSARDTDKVPMLLWQNVRLYNVDASVGFMDSVGGDQLDVRDVEAFYPKSKYEPNDIGNYIWNVTNYLITSGVDVEHESAFDGPGESNLTWMCELHDNSVIDPPRRVLRLFPRDYRDEVHALLARHA